MLPRYGTYSSVFLGNNLFSRIGGSLPSSILALSETVRVPLQAFGPGDRGGERRSATLCRRTVLSRFVGRTFPSSATRLPNSANFASSFAFTELAFAISARLEPLSSSYCSLMTCSRRTRFSAIIAELEISRFCMRMA